MIRLVHPLSLCYPHPRHRCPVYQLVKLSLWGVTHVTGDPKPMFTSPRLAHHHRSVVNHDPSFQALVFTQSIV